MITLLSIPILIVVIALSWRLWRPNWLGFGGKTLWDWVNVISVPMIVGFATLIINDAQKELEQRRAIESAIQIYFDRVTSLVIDDHVKPDLIEAVVRAQTRAILTIAEGEQAGRVLAFLDDVGLLKRVAPEFEGLDLHDSDLKGLDLSNLDFEDSDFSHAELEHANFAGTDFEDVDFAGADMDGALLHGADLRGAQGLTQAQMDGACYDETTLLPASIAAVTGDSVGCREDRDHNEAHDDD